MAHHHAHHVRPRDAKQDIETVISYEYVTMSQTFSGPAAYSTQAINSGALAFTRSTDAAKTTNSKPTSTADDDDDETSAPATSQAAQTRSDADPTTSVSRTSTLVSSSIATSAAATSSLASLSSSASSSHSSSSPVTATRAAAAGASSSAVIADNSTSSGGMSGGAKAGLAIGIILAIGLIFGVAFLLYRRKKQQQNYSNQVDDEKHGLSNGSNGFMAAPVAAAAAAETPRSTRTLSTAPRLSLRPVTEFLPNLAGNRKSAGNPLEAAGAAPRGYQAPAPRPAVSPWERRGAQNNANDPANPFGNHAELSEPVLNEKTPVAAAPQSPPASATSGRALTPPLVSSGADEVQRDADVPKPLSIKSNSSDASFATAASEPKVGTAIAAASPAAAAAAGVAGSAAVVATGKPALPPPDAVHRVQMDFTPSMDDELALKVGEIVRLLHEYDDGWALCIRMDRSQQGVVPRTCLSKNPVQPVQPRPANAPPPQARPRSASQSQQSRPSTRNGPQSPRHAGPGRPQSPASGRNSPGPFAKPPRPQSPASGRSSPGPHGRPGRPGHPMSPGRVPLGGFPTPPMSPAGRSHGGFPTPPRSPAKGAFPPGPPGSRARSQSNAGLHGAPRPMLPGTRAPQGMGESRRRSKSVGNVHEPFVPSPMGPMPNTPPSRIPVRKPVPGQSP